MFLADTDVHAQLEWEIAAFAVCGTAALSALGWFILDVVRRSRGTRKVLRHTVQHVGQHRDELVNKVRNGVPFPPLPEDPDD